MKFKLILLTAFIVVPFLGFAQQPLSGADSARKLVDTVLSYAKAKSIYRGRVNWQALTDSARKQSLNAGSVKEVMPTISLIYKMLGDYHGFTQYGGKYYMWRPKRPKRDSIIYKALFARIKLGTATIRSEILEKGYGWLQIPPNNPTHAGDYDIITQQIQDSLTKLNPATLKGLIIDLRLNSGGGMYPMILGVGNILGNGKLGSFIDPVSKAEEPWGIIDKAIYDGTDTPCRAKTYSKVNPKLKVVVLIGPYTASSGEATAITFKGQPNTTLIGEKTAGFTTANDSFRFYGIDFFMATAVEADRNGNVYYENVEPDKEVIGGDDFIDLTKDEKVIAALNWMKGYK